MIDGHLRAVPLYLHASFKCWNLFAHGHGPRPGAVRSGTSGFAWREHELVETESKWLKSYSNKNGLTLFNSALAGFSAGE